MKKLSTLIFLVNKIRSEARELSGNGITDMEENQKEQMDQYAPPDVAVNSVLNFARSLQVSETKAVGKLEWVLN